MNGLCNLSEHSRVALARIWLTVHGLRNLKVDGRSVDPLRRRNLIEPKQPGRGIRGMSSDYLLTAEGRRVCQHPTMVEEIRRQGQLERDRAAERAELHRMKAAQADRDHDGMVMALGVLEAGA